jgi:hypothetical protein
LLNFFLTADFPSTALVPVHLLWVLLQPAPVPLQLPPVSLELLRVLNTARPEGQGFEIELWHQWSEIRLLACQPVLLRNRTHAPKYPPVAGLHVTDAIFVVPCCYHSTAFPKLPHTDPPPGNGIPCPHSFRHKRRVLCISRSSSELARKQVTWRVPEHAVRVYMLAVRA